jgi:2-polyprenyl-3-methyl-5-hydroxy-6-metoxy-1,4-benzoquinol methylase
MNKCPYCGNRADHYFRVSSGIYNRCLRCDLVHKDIQGSYEKVLALYREGYFSRYLGGQVRGGRNRLFNHILDSIEANRGISRLLDVGTGCGFFLIAAQKGGWEVKGIEPSVQSVEAAQRRFGVDVFKGTLREFYGNGPFDVITFINVLDHSAEPWKEIDRARDLLESGGLIFIRFPNGVLHTRIYSLACRYGLANLVCKFLVFHEYSFTPRFIRRLLLDCGFSRIIILNSPPSEGDPHKLFYYPTLAKFIKRSFHLMAKAIELISSRKILLGASLEVMAVKGAATGPNLKI